MGSRGETLERTENDERFSKKRCKAAGGKQAQREVCAENLPRVSRQA